jgi:hypothetical protein
MRRISVIGVCLVVAVVIGTAFASVSFAYGPSLEGEMLLTSSSLASPFMLPVAATPGSMTPEMAVFTRKGISPARPGKAIAVQGEVAKTNLVGKMEDALASAYAGAWFEPATAKLRIGVTSDLSRRVAGRVIADMGLEASAIPTPVRSTWVELLAAQTRWGAKLARLLAPDESMIGISSQRNALVVKLSSSVAASKRAALSRAAARESVNVSIMNVPPSELRVQPSATECEYASQFNEAIHYAWCENTITSGVAIESASQRCTAGPMMIRGLKTFVLTAGHCVEKGKKEIGEIWESEYPNPAPPRNKDATKKLGKVTAFTDNAALDSAEIEVDRPGEFTAALPTPVPALMAEWGNWEAWTGDPPKGKPGVPIATLPEKQFESRVVSGESPPVEGFADCHEGKTSGEQCGVTGMTNVNPAGLAEHLVEDTACSEVGDSGGPYVYHGAGPSYLMEGTLVGGKVKNKCTNEGTNGEVEGEPGVEPRSYFEPMKTLLAAYPKERLLTTANEVRKPRVKGAKGASLTKKGYTSTSGASTIETVGGTKLACTADSGKGEASAESSGTAKLTLTGCEGSGEKCHTSGAAEGEVVLSANYELAFINGAEDEVGLLLKLTEATIECGKNCKGKAVETLKLRGTGIGAATPIDEEVAPPKKFTVAFSQAKGVQSPTEYENENGTKVKAILEMEGSGTKVFAFEQAGISDTDELLFEETAEIEA